MEDKTETKATEKQIAYATIIAKTLKIKLPKSETKVDFQNFIFVHKDDYKRMVSNDFNQRELIEKGKKTDGNLAKKHSI